MRPDEIRARRLERSKPVTRAAPRTPTIKGEGAELAGQFAQSGFEQEQGQRQPRDSEVFAGDESPDQGAEAERGDAGGGHAQRVALSLVETICAAPERRVDEGVSDGGGDGERERGVRQVDRRGDGADAGQRVALRAEIAQAAPPAEGERAERHEGPDDAAPAVAGFEAGDEHGHRGGGVAVPDFGGLERAI